MNNTIQIGGTSNTLLKVLLICGILASSLYVATDILAGMLWESDRLQLSSHQWLSAIGAPTRPLVVMLGILYDVLLIAFGLCVWVYLVVVKEGVHSA